MVLNHTRRAIAGRALTVLFGAKCASGSAKPIGVTDDAELFRLSRDCLEANRRFRDVVQQQEAVARPMTAANAAEWDRLDDLACKWSARVAEIEDQIKDVPARTTLGSQVKRQTLAMSLPLNRRPAGLEKAVELTLARACCQ